SLAISLAGLLMATLVSACGASSATQTEAAGHAEDSGDGHAAEAAEPAKGPHGGRLLQDGAFALEVTIFETGVDPQYRIYPTLDGKAIDPSAVDLSVTLSRLGGKKDVFRFAPEAEYLKGDGVVAEPHSFDVSVLASHDGNSHTWTYESYEGRTMIADAVAAEAGVQTEPAGPGLIRERIELSGTVQLTPSATADVRAVYPGRVLRVTRTVGETVRKGDLLAEVENSSSLQTYSVRAPISGTVLERRTNAGDVAASEPLFVIGDIGAAQAELHVFPKDAGRIKPGQSVTVMLAGGDLTAEGKIDSFKPLAEAGTQALIARVVLPREAGFRPGMRVTAAVTTSETQVPLLVRESGLQRFRDFTVVFAKYGETYEVRMLDFGRKDGEFVEVLGGIDPGENYVTENSFLIKADIDKSGASHDH
ncbi:MAG: HlyD family efflux transporter periplasmic adaptor subunit, partial [Hyphomonas sp.]|nr:HlyD family efflux transporter periplasmic adaptor subunit [Hyphomonas sp.]